MTAAARERATKAFRAATDAFAGTPLSNTEWHQAQLPPATQHPGSCPAAKPKPLQPAWDVPSCTCLRQTTCKPPVISSAQLASASPNWNSPWPPTQLHASRHHPGTLMPLRPAPSQDPMSQPSHRLMTHSSQPSHRRSASLALAVCRGSPGG